jgi:anti-sigma-K factor RskA
MRIGHGDLHLLTGAYAVDALDPVEFDAFERHLTRCGPCATETGGLSEAAARLAIGAALPPPPAMRQRVMDASYQIRQLPPATQPPLRRLARPVSIRLLSQRLRFRRPLFRKPGLRVSVVASLAAISLVVVTVLGVAQVRTTHQLDTARAVAAVLSAPDAQAGSRPANGGGTVTVIVSRTQRSAVVTAADLPPLPPSEVYQLWLLDPAGVRSAGLIAATQHGSTTPLLAAGVRAGDRFGITVEPAGGTTRPTTTPLIVMPLPT